MQTPDEIRRDLPPGLEREESDRLVATALRLLATACGMGGAALLAVAAIGVAGVGPFAAG